jgi:signal transduction histidine kinase
MNAKVTELQLKYDTETKQEQINQLTINQQAQTQKYLLAGLIILIGLVGYVFWIYRKLLQKNKEISTAVLQGQTTERKRIAADLHDNLGSTMSALRWTLEAINPKQLGEKEQEVYQQLQSSIAQAYDQVRLLSHNFLPEELEKQGLWVALGQLIRKLNRNTPVKFSLQLPENQVRLDEKTEFELYSICLELINNILKHAKATEASIECRIQSGECRMVISDNGKGISENNSSGKGLRNIAERVKSLGGTWKVKSDEGNGVVNEIVVNVNH